MPFIVEVPKNDFNIPSSFLYMGWLAELLEENKNRPEVISFLASVLKDSDENICEMSEEDLSNWSK